MGNDATSQYKDLKSPYGFSEKMRNEAIQLCWLLDAIDNVPWLGPGEDAN